jgi:hypothetical protein
MNETTELHRIKTSGKSFLGVINEVKLALMRLGMKLDEQMEATARRAQSRGREIGLLIQAWMLSKEAATPEQRKAAIKLREIAD